MKLRDVSDKLLYNSLSKDPTRPFKGFCELTERSGFLEVYLTRLSKEALKENLQYAVETNNIFVCRPNHITHLEATAFLLNEYYKKR